MLGSFIRWRNHRVPSKPAPGKQKRTQRPRIKSETVFSECMADGPYSTVRASDVVRFVNSQFSLWCDRFADTSEQDPPDPIMEELARRGNIHENRILEEEQPDIVHIAADPEEWPEGIGGMNVRIDGNNNEESFLLGINAMMGGAETLSKAMLFYLPDGMVGIPDLLRRANGKSAFGSYYYTVIEVKSARNITYAHRLQAAFYTALIGRIQRKTPRTFQIINGNGTLEEFKFADYERSLDRIMERIRDVFANSRPAAVFGHGRHPWVSYTNRTAVKTGNTTLISGIGPVGMQHLAGAGITTLDEMISAGIDRVAAVSGIGLRRAAAYMESALALSGNTAVRRRTAGHALLGERTEMFLDLEGMPGATASDAAIYLIGLLVREDGQEEYVSFVRANSGPKRIVLDFIKFIAGRECPIYHWGYYDRLYLIGMMEKYGIAAPAFMESSLTDLHQVAANSFAFPLPSINLKDLAGWMGFRWTNPDVNAFNSYELYRSYRLRKNKDDLKMVLDYNMDDCRATAVVRDWLVKNGKAAPA